MEVFRTKSCLKNIEYQNSYLEENQDKFCLENHAPFQKKSFKVGYF